MRGHLEVLGQDVRYAARGFLRAPLFTAAALFALALGIGAGSAVFGVVDRILFRSLPYPEDGRLVSFGMVAPIAPQEFMLGYDYLDWRDAQTPFASLGSWTGPFDCDLTDSNPARLRCAPVDSALLATLGVQPALGRSFTREEDRPNAPPLALISHGLWRGRFAADPAVVGKTLLLDGQSRTVLGVLPADFELPTLARADVLVPLALDEVQQRTRRTAILLNTVARLKPGITAPQAAAALQPLLAKSLQSVPPEFRKDVKLRVRPLRDRQIQDARSASWILLASVLAVLLIACANVANLLLARGASRQQELAVRAALGAGRGRLIRQALTESALLGVAGAAAGCALAFVLLKLFVAVAPEGIPRLGQAALDARVLLFTLAVALVSSLVFGLAPALQGHTLKPRRGIFREVLVAAQVCASLILLTGASLLLRSLWNLQNQPLGFRTDQVLTASVTLGRQSYPDPARRLAFFEDLEARLAAIPGVNEVALADSVPPTSTPLGTTLYGAIDVEGRPRSGNGTGGSVVSRAITPRYFSALAIPILRGRGFTEQDRDPNSNVVILSDTLARRMFPGEDPLLKRIRPGRNGPWLSVIGVAANVKNTGLVNRDDPEYYLVRKHAPVNVGRAATAIVRGTVNPATLRAAFDRTLPVEIETLDLRVGKLAARPRFNALLLGIFAAMGLLLAAIGLYGVVSFLVAQRTREIGVRMALGATPAHIARVVLKHAARSTAAGAALGVAGSLFAGRLLHGMLFHVSARDPWTLVAALAILGAAALLAACIPSRRAARIDPMRALRQE